MHYFLATPTSVDAVERTASELLRDAGHAAYTTARTNDAGHVFKLSQHLSRMTETVDILHGRGHLPFPAGPALSSQLRAAGRRAMEAFHADTTTTSTAAADAAKPAVKLTFLVTASEAGEARVTAHAGALTAREAPRGGARCLVGGKPREDARAKDSEWVSQRASLEAAMDWSTEEVVLADADGALMEGTQTNFFAVVGGAVHTAGDGVLHGTVRALALEVCAEEGMPVVLSPPGLGDAAGFEGAFIASTSRLVMPVSELVLLPDAAETLGRLNPGAAADAGTVRPAGEGRASVHDERPRIVLPDPSVEGSVVDRVRRAVLAKFDAACEPL